MAGSTRHGMGSRETTSDVLRANVGVVGSSVGNIGRGMQSEELTFPSPRGLPAYRLWNRAAVGLGVPVMPSGPRSSPCQALASPCGGESSQATRPVGRAAAWEKAILRDSRRSREKQRGVGARPAVGASVRAERWTGGVGDRHGNATSGGGTNRWRPRVNGMEVWWVSMRVVMAKAASVAAVESLASLSGGWPDRAKMVAWETCERPRSSEQQENERESEDGILSLGGGELGSKRQARGEAMSWGERSCGADFRW